MTPRYLSLLTPARSFALFAGALVVGGTVIAGDIRPTWVAVLPVFAYGGMLLYSQQRHLVALSGTVKDSPYFLGFILTMGALAKIFYGIHLGTGGATSALDPVIGDAGTAILLTVAGLFMRQVLTSLDPGEDARDEVFQSLARELRERTLDFHETQARFVGLLREFVSAREALFSREEAAFSGYVERLERGTAILSNIDELYPKRVEHLLDGLSVATATLATRFEGCASDLSRVAGTVTALTERELQATRDAIRESRDGLVGAREQMAAETAAVAAGISHATAGLRQHVEEFALEWEKYMQPGEAFAESVRAAASDLTRLRAEVAGLEERAREAALALKQTTDAAGASTDSLNDTARLRAERLRDELDAIDAVIDEFVRVLRNRIQQQLAS